MSDIEEAKYVAAFASGLQNGVLTVTTGFARTTHVTGTVTDVGLLVGQGVNKATWTNESHWWKARTLSYLVVLFVAGGATALLLFDNAGLEEATMIIPAAGTPHLTASVVRQMLMNFLPNSGLTQLWAVAPGAFLLGLLWQVHCRQEQTKVAAHGEAAESQSLGAGVVQAMDKTLKAASNVASTMTKMLAALAAEVPTIDSMPDKPSCTSYPPSRLP